MYNVQYISYYFDLVKDPSSISRSTSSVFCGFIIKNKVCDCGVLYDNKSLFLSNSKWNIDSLFV